MKDDLTTEELVRLREIINADKMPGLSLAALMKDIITGEVHYLSITWRTADGHVAMVGLETKSLLKDALAIIALETSLAEVARERGLWLVCAWPDDSPGDVFQYEIRGGRSKHSPNRLTALVRCTIAAFEGVEL